MLQAGPVDHRHARENAVEIVGIALRHGQPFAPAFGRSHEVQFCRRIAVGAQHQRHGGIAHLLVGAMREVLERLVIERKHLRRLAGLGLVAGVRAIGDEAARQRRGRAERRGRRQRKAGYQHAVEAAAAMLQRAAVPLDRQIDLEADRRRVGIGRVDVTEHLAEFGVGRRDAAGRRRPLLGDRHRRGRLHRGGVDLYGVVCRPGKAAAGGRGIAVHFGGYRFGRKGDDQRDQQSPRARIDR